VPETAEARPGEASRTEPSPVANALRQGSRVENSLTLFTLVAAIVAFAIGWVVALHSVATVVAVVTFVVGMYAQLMSSTREHRILIVTGLVAAFVAGALAIAHGGVG
jgi:uncharacterized membrane protein YoaK (UPF0700 family)